MPLETRAVSARHETTPHEPSFTERRDALFDRLVANRPAEAWGVKLVRRVAEHSTEDGLRLAERLAFTPKQYRETFLGVPFRSKHPSIFDALARESKKLRPRTEDEEQFVDRIKFLSASVPDSLVPAERRIREVKMLNPDHPFHDIDNLYLDAFMAHPPKLKAKQEARRTDVRSKGEKLGERYLESVEEVLERRYYTGPMKEIFPSFKDSPIFYEPTVTEDALLAWLKQNKLQVDSVMHLFKPARVVAYQGIDAIKRGVAQ